MRTFYAECFKRAWRGRLLHVEGVSGVLGLFAIPLATHFQIATRLGYGNEFLNWLPFYIFAAIFAATLTFGFVTAPYWIAAEIETQRDGLQATLDTSHKRQEAINELWDLRSLGISLRNFDPGPTDDFTSWKARYENWRTEVLGAAEIVSVNLKNWLGRLDHTCDVPAGLPIRSSEHELLMRIMSEMLLRMETYMTREMR